MTLDGLQDALKAVIDADAWITDKGIGCEVATHGDIESRVKVRLAKLGICAVIEPGEPEISYGGGLINYQLRLGVFVFENVLLNRSATGSGVHASELVAKLIHLFKPGTSSPASCIIKTVELVEDAGPLLVYRCAMVGVLAVEEPVLEAP